MPSSSLVRLCVLAAAAPLLAACPGRDRDAADAAVRIDTTNEEALDGLSAEQLQRQAEPMSPEEARAMGIVDTTIHLEQERDADTIVPEPPLPGIPPSDTIEPLGAGVRP